MSNILTTVTIPSLISEYSKFRAVTTPALATEFKNNLKNLFKTYKPLLTPTDYDGILIEQTETVSQVTLNRTDIPCTLTIVYDLKKGVTTVMLFPNSYSTLVLETVEFNIEIIRPQTYIATYYFQYPNHKLILRDGINIEHLVSTQKDLSMYLNMLPEKEALEVLKEQLISYIIQ